MAVTEKQRRAMNREIAQEQAMINRRLEAEKYMQAEIEREAASRIPSVPTVANPMSADPRSANFIPTNQVGLLPRPPVTYTAEGSRMQTPPLSMPTAQALLGASTPVEQIGPAMQGIRIGNDQGDANRSKEEQLGFMDKIFSNPMLQRLMERSLYSQPTFGGNFISEQASGERGLRSVEAQSAERQNKLNIAANKLQATSAEKQLDRENKIAAAKAGKVGIKMSSLKPIADQYNKNSQARALLSQIKSLVPGDAVGGIPAKFNNFINGFGAAFGLNPDITQSQKINAVRANLIRLAELNKGRMNKNDYEVMNTAFNKAGELTTTPSRLLEAISNMDEELVNSMQVNSVLLRSGGVDPIQFKQLSVSNRTKAN
tara:strand:+ start:609 stop:1724 length:1116 start_codon:yes stop_codon:yes gene_type:complete